MSQARLDLISKPGPEYYHSYVRWINRLTNQADYPSEELLCRRYEIGPEIAQLKRAIQDAGSPAELRRVWLKLRRMEAQARAIDETLERRSRADRRTR